MSQIVELPAPIIKPVSPEEEKKLRDKHQQLVNAGDKEGVINLISELPMSAWMLNKLKNMFGIEFLLVNHYNLIRAIEVYGEEWLES